MLNERVKVLAREDPPPKNRERSRGSKKNERFRYYAKGRSSAGRSRSLYDRDRRGRRDSCALVVLIDRSILAALFDHKSDTRIVISVVTLLFNNVDEIILYKFLSARHAPVARAYHIVASC